jgi:hypothetical protein
MNVLAIDLSSSPGLAIVSCGSPGHFVLHEHQNKKFKVMAGSYPYDWIAAVDGIVRYVTDFVNQMSKKHTIDVIVIEQTNLGKQRFTQQVLEWLHISLLRELKSTEHDRLVKYVSTSEWRKRLDLRLSKDEKKQNKALKNAEDKKAFKEQQGIAGKKTQKHLSVDYVNKTFGQAFLMKDNDICDAICMACAAFDPNTQYCDGKTKGH